LEILGSLLKKKQRMVRMATEGAKRQQIAGTTCLTKKCA
jgi:hypothetical protein